MEYRADIGSIAEICREEGIELVFIIFPSHMDLQNKIVEFGLEDADTRMRSDLRKWGVVYDFAWENAYTRDAAEFRDPYHFGPELHGIIVDSVWGEDRRFVRVYDEKHISVINTFSDGLSAVNTAHQPPDYAR